MYEHFIDGNETPYVKKTNEFVQYGFYTSPVGDLMPLAMATLPIVLPAVTHVST